MKKVKKVIVTLLPSSFVLALVLPISIGLKPKIDEAGEDTAIYSEKVEVKDYNQPDFHLGGDDDDDDDEPFVAPERVRLHYFNESGVTGSTIGKQRAFYIWANGVDGIEINRYENNVYDPAGEGEENIIYSVNEDGTMMTIDIDYSKPIFDPYKGKSSLMFIIKYEKISASDLNWGGQSEDTQLSFRTYPPVNGLTEVWAMSSGGNGITIVDSYNKTQVHGVKKAEFTDWKTIHCDVTNDTKRVDWKLYAFDETYFKIKPKKRADYEKNYLVKEGTNSGSEFDITLKYEAHINMVYSLVSHDPESDIDPDMAQLDKTAKISFEDLYYTEKFHTYYEKTSKLYSYKGKNQNARLGMIYSPQATTFRVWSPISANMSVLIYEDGTPVEYGDTLHPGDDKAKGFHMNYLPGGIWEVTVTGNLAGKYYNLQVDNVLGTNVTMDPYATSSGVCGVRGYIFDKNSSEFKPGTSGEWDNFLSHNFPNPGNKAVFTPQDLSIYEVHIQDLTDHTYEEGGVKKSSWNGTSQPGTYNAFVEKGTRLPGDSSIKTGYDHLNELGMNAIQITPTFDHDNDERPAKMKYNWGYNPLNYNIPEGGYSSNPYKGDVRVKEFRNLVLQMYNTDVHTRVIMDVVYNHVSSASASNFNKLMPRYYFRYARANIVYGPNAVKEKGDIYDGSGCSNEVATERPMMRKFIVESLCMWAEDYGIKGFRFDLMGLIDFVTMQEAQKALYEIDPTIYMYGESWTGTSYEHTSDNFGGYHGEGSKEWYIENPGKTATTFGTFRYQVLKECNVNNTAVFPGKKAVYLGAFNDKTRDAMRGENNMWGARMIQNGDISSDYKPGSDHNLVNDVARGLWGENHTDNDYGRFPEGSVTYLSCHDNFTLRDQLYNTLEMGEPNYPASTEMLIRATIQAHALTFASNSAAFMQGGEELLRTKELDWDPENPDEEHKQWQVKPSDCAYMHGHWICHNSYNTPYYINAFDWRMKKSVTVDGVTKDVSASGMNVTGAFKAMFYMHTVLAKKRGFTDVEKWGDFSLFSSTGDEQGVEKPVDNIVWGYWNYGSDPATTCGIQVNTAIIYASFGHNYCYPTIDWHVQPGVEAQDKKWDLLFEYGTDGPWYDSEHDALKHQFKNRFAIAIYNSKNIFEW